MINPSLRHWVLPFYGLVVNGNFASKSTPQDTLELFARDVRRALEEITPDITSRLLDDSNWRAIMMGSWFAGLKRYSIFRARIGELLFAPRCHLDAPIHAFAMACFEDGTSTQYLINHLRSNNRRKSQPADLDWVTPALLWIDNQFDSNHSTEFIDLNGSLNCTPYQSETVAQDLSGDIQNGLFFRAMNYCQTNFIRRNDRGQIEPDDAGQQSVGPKSR